MNRLLLFALLLFTSFLTASAKEPVKLAFTNADVREVIALYQRLTAKKVIYDNTVQGTVSLSEPAPVGQGKAIELIEKTLFADGFFLIDASGDTISIVGLARNPRSLGLPTLSKPEAIPAGERVFTYIFKLRHRAANEVAQLISAQIAPSTYTSVIPDQKSGTIVVTERTSVIRGLLTLVANFDVN